MIKKNLLEIKNLRAEIDEKEILKEINLTIKTNETHILLGPNGSGKSTLSKILAGHPSYLIKEGQINFHGKNLLEMTPDIRAHEGLFLGFQYPLEISGITTYDFLRIAYNEKQKYYKKRELDPLEFMEFLKEPLKKVNLNYDFLNRNLNEGFSGGEKKRNEILQMLLLQPNLILLDEIDSGLDIESLKTICETVTEYLSENSSLLFVTHNIKTLTYLKPTFLHFMINGKLTTTNDFSFLHELDTEGYEKVAEKTREKKRMVL